MNKIKSARLPMIKADQGARTMSQQSELDRAIIKGYAVINTGIEFSYESSWRKYCREREKTRIQIRKQDKFHSIIQLWKPDQHPFTKSERLFMKSTNLPIYLSFWNWYAESDLMDTLDAKAKILCLVRFFEEIDEAA